MGQKRTYKQYSKEYKEEAVALVRELGYSIHMGGRSSLELQGFAHYLSMTGIKQVLLYGADKLPG